MRSPRATITIPSPTRRRASRSASGGLPNPGYRPGRRTARRQDKKRQSGRRRSLTALSNASGSFRRSRATPVRGSTASVEATEMPRKMAAASQLQRRTADGAATTRGVSLEDAGARCSIAANGDVKPCPGHTPGSQPQTRTEPVTIILQFDGICSPGTTGTYPALGCPDFVFSGGDQRSRTWSSGVVPSRIFQHLVEDLLGAGRRGQGPVCPGRASGGNPSLPGSR